MKALPRKIALALLAIGIAGCGSDSSPYFSGSYAPQQNQPTALQLAGKISYQRLLPNSSITADSPVAGDSRLDFAQPVVTPCRFVRVQALSSDNTVLSESGTNSQGEYQLSLPAGTGQVKVRVLSETATVAGFQGGIRVQDNTQNNALYASDSSLVNAGSGRLDMLLQTGYDAQGNQTASVRGSSPFAALDGLLTGYLFWVSTGVDPTPLPKCIANWSELNRPGSGEVSSGAIDTSHFRSDPNQLYILGDRNTDTDEYDWHVMIHEFGHWIQFNRFRSNGGGGGHGAGQIKEPLLTFAEGFGNATGGLALNDAIYRDTDKNSGRSSSMERNLGQQDSSPGWFSEASVELLIYDLFDPIGVEAGSNFNDQLALPLSALRQALDFQKESPALTTVFSFLAGLRANGVTQGQLEPLLAVLSPSADFGLNSQEEFGAGETHSAGLPSLPLYVDVTTEVSRDNANQAAVPLALKAQLDTDENWLQANRYWMFVGDGQPLTVTVKNSTSATGNVEMDAFGAGRNLGNRSPNTAASDVFYYFDTTVVGRIYILSFTNKGQVDSTVDIEFQH
jgi:hypothetical protein